MTQSIVLDSQALVLELHRLLRDFDSAKYRDEFSAALRARMASAEARISSLADAADQWAQHSELANRLRDLRATLRHQMTETKLPLSVRWAKSRSQIYAAYERFLKSLELRAADLPPLRPTNYSRSLFHVISAAVAIVVIEAVARTSVLLIIACAFAGMAWSMESARRLSHPINLALMRFFGKVAHPHERYRVNSATWYATALVVLSAFPPAVSATAVAILGVADPAAALVGRRYGQLRLVNGRSLEGTLAFVGAGMVTAIALLFSLHSELGWTQTLLVATLATVFAAIAELLSRRLDDNLLIPLAGGAGGALALALLGLTS